MNISTDRESIIISDSLKFCKNGPLQLLLTLIKSKGKRIIWKIVVDSQKISRHIWCEVVKKLSVCYDTVEISPENNLAIVLHLLENVYPGSSVRLTIESMITCFEALQNGHERSLLKLFPRSRRAVTLATTETRDLTFTIIDFSQEINDVAKGTSIQGIYGLIISQSTP